MNSNEEVRRISLHPNYWVSDQGNVYREKQKELYPLQKDICCGFARVTLNRDKCYVGRLVLEAFCPTKDIHMQAYHIDGNKLNDSLDNLVWLTKSQIHRYSYYADEYKRTEAYRREVLGLF